MTATIKICGLRDYNAIKMSVDSGAKYLGVFDFVMRLAGFSGVSLAVSVKG